MNDIIENGAATSARDDSLRTLGHISYALHAIVADSAVLPGVQASIALLLVAFDEARGTWQESHFSWRIHSVLWAGFLYVVTIPLWFLFLFPGWIAWGLISIWFLYRVIRGWLALADRRPMPT
jgi:uncharacterized membrane protein